MKLKNKLLTGLTALVLSAGAANAQNQSYVRSDSFDSWVQMNNQSIDHSPIEVTPTISMNGVLYWKANESGLFNGAVNFQTGSDLQSADRYPHLTYRLPIERNEEFRGVVGAIVDFTGYFPSGSSIKLYASENATDWRLFCTVADNGVRWYSIPLYNINGPVEYVKIVGDRISLDRLQFNVFCDNVVGDQKLSFGQVKGMYK